MRQENIIEQEKRLKERMSLVRYKIIIISGKGGVGKTTVAVNLAYRLAQKKYKVGILDIDIHGPNVAKMLGVEDRRLMGSKELIEPVNVLPNLKAISFAFLLENPDQPVIWRGPLKTVLIRQFLSDVNWGHLDHLIIDSPPGTGDEPLSVCQLIPDIDGAIIVTTPQDVAVLDSRKSIMFAKELNIPVIGIIENMSGFICPYCKRKIDLFGVGGAEKASSDLRVPFLGRIPFEPTIVEYSDRGDFSFKTEDNSFNRIMDEIIEKILNYLKLKTS